MNLRLARALAAAVCMVMLLVGCGLGPWAAPVQEPDPSGRTVGDVATLRLQEQYEMAADRYRELNDVFAQLQGEIFDTEWREGGTRSEVIPGQGYTLSERLGSDNRDNSYYFSVSRYIDPEVEDAVVMTRIEQLWKARRWAVSSGFREISGRGEVVARTERGDSFHARVLRSGALELTVFGPVYWGDSLALGSAIAERRNIEDERDGDGAVTRDDLGRVLRLPGSYRPFPEWDPLQRGVDG